MRELYSRLLDAGDPLATEASEAIIELEGQADSLRDNIGELEREAAELRLRVSELEGARLCSPCAFGTVAQDSVFCVACGGRR